MGAAVCFDLWREAYKVFGEETVKELCKVCDVSFKTVYRWRSGESKPPKKHLKRFAQKVYRLTSDKRLIELLDD